MRCDGSTVFRTARLRLRPWSPDDLPRFADLNADAEVMRYIGRPLSRRESDDLAVRILRHFDEHGFGLWAVERQEEPGFIGCVGLLHVNFEAAFTPAVEIGWRIARAHWRMGYATEAARMALQIAFEALSLSEVVAFTNQGNLASRRVMEKLGMTRAEDFAHPKLPPENPLAPHVLFRIRNPSL